MPQRIQLSRRKGWRKPEGAVVVSRPFKFGNPFRVGGGSTPSSAKDRASAVNLFRTHALGVWPWTEANIREELAGRDLACWCPLDQPCHADVLLDIANSQV